MSSWDLQVSEPGKQLHLAPIVQELRRGADPACIYSIAFSRGERPQWLALSSDKGTVHVFSLDQRQPAPAVRNAPSDAASGQRNPVSPLSFVSVSLQTAWLPVLNLHTLRVPADLTSELPSCAGFCLNKSQMQPVRIPASSQEVWTPAVS